VKSILDAGWFLTSITMVDGYYSVRVTNPLWFMGECERAFQKINVVARFYAGGQPN